MKDRILLRIFRGVMGGAMLSGGVAALGASPFDGLAGAALLEAVRDYATPRTVITRYEGADGRLAILAEAEAVAPGKVLDRFTNETFTMPGNDALPASTAIQTIVPISWWHGAYDGTIGLDLNNMVFAPTDVASLKSDYPPGEVEQATYSNGVWSVGTITVSGTRTNVFTPPTGSEGDFARTFMYMAVVYGMDWWSDVRASMVMEDGRQYALTDYAKRLFLKWCAADPVDDFERSRAKVIGEAQGAENPFITYPEIAEYLWGDKAGEVFTASTPGDSDSVSELKPLKAKYSIATDHTLDLTSPYISGDVTWSVDGTSSTTQRIPLESLGTGRHEVRFSGAGINGGINIEIEP